MSQVFKLDSLFVDRFRIDTTLWWVPHSLVGSTLFDSLVCFLFQAAAEGSDGSDGSAEDDSDEEESSSGGEESDDGKEDEEENEPLSLEWPETTRKQATYLFLLPIVFPLWLTLPDVRNLVSTSCQHPLHFKQN